MSGARTWYIYGLVEPGSDAIRYVGWAFNPEKRLADHLYKAQKGTAHKDRWLRLLLSRGARPTLVILESGVGEGWADAERRWISRFRANGADLVNATDGGEGVVGLKFSAASRAKIGAAHRGKKLSPEHIAKVVAATRGKKRSPEVVARFAAKRKGHIVTPETRAKLSAAIKGSRHTPEARAKMSAFHRSRDHTAFTKAGNAARRGKPLSEEMRRKISAALKGRTLTEEHKANIRASHPPGRRHTPAAIAKMSAARRERAARERAARLAALAQLELLE